MKRKIEEQYSEHLNLHNYFLNKTEWPEINKPVKWKNWNLQTEMYRNICHSISNNYKIN